MSAAEKWDTPQEPPRAPRSRSLTRDFLGETFANQVKPLNAAANDAVDPSFGDVVSGRRPIPRLFIAVVAAAALGGAAYYFLLM